MNNDKLDKLFSWIVKSILAIIFILMFIFIFKIYNDTVILYNEIEQLKLDINNLKIENNNLNKYKLYDKYVI